MKSHHAWTPFQKHSQSELHWKSQALAFLPSAGHIENTTAFLFKTSV